MYSQPYDPSTPLWKSIHLNEFSVKTDVAELINKQKPGISDNI